MTPRRGLFDLRPGERLRTALLAASILTIVASYTMVKAVRDAVFLAKFSTSELAVVYIAIALFAGVLSAVGTRLGHGVRSSRLILATNAVVSVSLVALWVALREHVPGTPWLLYLWSSFFGLFVIANFWLLANQINDARSAKRIFPLVGAGAIVGGVVGGQATTLASVIGAVNLLPIIAAGFMASAFLAAAAWRHRVDGLGREEPRAEASPSAAEGFRLVRHSRYLRLIGLLLLLGTVVTTLVDLQLKAVAKEYFGSNRDAMATYFGQLTMILSLVSLFVQLFITPSLIRRLGVGRTLLVLPTAMAIGAGAIGLHAGLMLPAVTAVAIAKIGDGGLRFSLDKAAFELLWVPVPAAVRSRAKPVVDTVSDRTGTAVTGVIWLVLIALVGSGVKMLVQVGALATLVVLGFWLMTVYRTRREYVEAFRVALPGAQPDPHAIRVDLRDARQREALRAALRSPDPRAVQLALDVLLGAPSPPALPEVGPLTQHLSPELRARAWDVLTLAGDRRMTARATRDVSHPSPEVRAAAVRYLAHATDGLVDELAGHPDVRVRLAALAYLARQGREDAARASGHIEEILSAGPPDRQVRVEVAAALGALPLDEARRHLPRLLFDGDERVAYAAGSSAGRLAFFEPLPDLLAALGGDGGRRSARAALRGFGPCIVRQLAAALEDGTVPARARQAVPSLLAQVGTRAAAEALLSILHRSDGPLRTRVVRALWRLRREARTRLGDDAFRHLLEDEARTYAAHLEALNECLGAAPGMCLLRRALQEKLDDDLERIFRLLGLRYPERDVLAAYYGLRREEAVLRASALELLDNLLDKPLERQLLGLIESHANPARIRRPAAARSTAETLRALAGDADPWLRACAVYTLAEAALADELPEVVEAAARDDDERVREAAVLAKRMIPSLALAATSEVPC